MESDEVKAGLVGDDAAIVSRFAVRSEDRQLDERKGGMKARAPHDVLHVEHPAILEYGFAILCSDDAWRPLHAGVEEVLRPGPDERTALRRQLRTRLASHGRSDGQQAMKDEPQNEAKEDPAPEEAVAAKRHPT